MASLFFTTTFCCMFIAAAAAAPPSPPLTLKLERAVSNQSMQQLSLHDFGRHQRMFHPPGANHFTNFSLHGSYSVYVAGLYYTTVTLGTPPRSFNVMIDTGSDIMWINCLRCAGCQDATILPVRLSYFDPRSSSTSSSISCSDKRCSSDFTRCNDNRCGYRLHYGDDSETSGIFTSDLLHFTTISVGSRTTGSSSTPIVFGNMRTGLLSTNPAAVDGIFGLGQGAMSIMSQLYSQGIAPGVFSHCLRGDGGGVLVLGEIVEPSIVYSKLVPSMPVYSLYLHSISVNDKMLQIDPAVFATSGKIGAVIDSGTTLAYLPEEAYNQFDDAIAAAIPSSVHIVTLKGNRCYSTTNSVADVFPQASFNFADGASLVLRPQDYLIKGNAVFDGVWCLGFQKGDITILGELVLKDKIFV